MHQHNPRPSVRVIRRAVSAAAIPALARRNLVPFFVAMRFSRMQIAESIAKSTRTQLLQMASLGPSLRVFLRASARGLSHSEASQAFRDALASAA